MTRKAPWAKLTILRTPSTTRRPAATENRIDAVVAMSRTRENIAGQRLAEMDEAVGADAARTRQRSPLFSGGRRKLSRRAKLLPYFNFSLGHCSPGLTFSNFLRTFTLPSA